MRHSFTKERGKDMKKCSIILIVLLMMFLFITTVNALPYNVVLPYQEGTVDFDFDLSDGVCITPFTIEFVNSNDGCNVDFLSLAGHFNILFELIDAETEKCVYARSSIGLSEGGMTTIRIQSYDVEKNKKYYIKLSCPSQEASAGTMRVSEVQVVNGERVENESFADVKFGYSYHKILNLKGKKILEGDENGKFNPGNNVTRAEWVKMVAVATGYTKDCQLESADEEHWVYPYVSYCYEKGFLDEIEEFKPEEEVTLSEAMSILVKAMGYPEGYAFKQGGNDGYAVIAEELGVYKNSWKREYNQSFPRYNAAIYIFNALDKPMMEGITDAEGTTIYNISQSKCLMNTYFK